MRTIRTGLIGLNVIAVTMSVTNAMIGVRARTQQYSDNNVNKIIL